MEEELEKISKHDVQDFIFSNEHADEKTLVLQHKDILGVPAHLIADQIKGRKKAKEKLPTWFKTRGIVYPPSVNIEQSSSETTALFKSTVIKELKESTYNLCDLTGGFGVDSFFLSRIFKTVDVVEPNEKLLKTTAHNFRLLGASNVNYHSQTAESFLAKSSGQYDLIFIDPSRRDSEKNKVFRLAECSPDVTQLQQSWFGRADHVLIKAAPMLDIQQGMKELIHVQKIVVLSVDNECRELLFLCTKGASNEPELECINLQSATPMLLTALSSSATFTFTFSEERQAIVTTSVPQHYIYEANASIMKAGAFKLVAQNFNLSKLHPNTHLYTGADLVPTFPGRIFEILESPKLDKNIKSMFPGGQTNIITRNYPLSVEEVKKKTGLTEGGVLYLICCTSEKEKHTLIARRLK